MTNDWKVRASFPANLETIPTWWRRPEDVGNMFKQTTGGLYLVAGRRSMHIVIIEDSGASRLMWYRSAFTNLVHAAKRSRSRQLGRRLCIL